MTGFVDVYYGYNFNKVDPRAAHVRRAAQRLLAEPGRGGLREGASTADSRVGFRADLDFGKTADLVAAYEPESDGKEIYKHIQQAYVSVLTGKVQFDAGKFVTPDRGRGHRVAGQLELHAVVLFGYAIPFYHTGVRATFTATDKLSLAGYLVNGWNNASEIDGDKTFALGGDAEADRQGHLDRQLHGRQGSRRPRHPATSSTPPSPSPPRRSSASWRNFDYGKEGDVEWWGIAAYAKLPGDALLGPRRRATSTSTTRRAAS